MYNLTFHSYSISCCNYDRLFGDCFGENFANTIDECFYSNSLHDYGKRNPSGQNEGKAPMDEELSLKHLMGAIHAVYNCAKGPRRNSSMAKLLGCRTEHIPLHGIIINDTFDDSATPIVTIRNVADNIGNAIIWAAYFFASIKASFSDEEAEVRDYLRNLFLRQINMDEYNYNTRHVGSLLFDLYYDSTVKKIAEDLQEYENPSTTDEDCDEENDEEFDEEHDLSYVVETMQQTINNLQRQIDCLNAKVEELEAALNPTGIREGYESDVDSVFLPTFTVAGQTVGTHDRVRKAAIHCIDPNEPIQVALFVEACRRLGGVRNLGIVSPTKIVRSLIGLGVLEKDKESKNYIENVRRKLNNLIAEKNLNVDEDKLDIMIQMLKKSVII